MTTQEEWDIAEKNMIQLEEVDTWFYGVSVERLREIRILPIQGYWTLSDSEKHYWLRTAERHGDNIDRLKVFIANIEKDDMQIVLADQIRKMGAGNKLLGDALKKALTKQAKKVNENTPNTDNMTETEKEWLSLRITPKKERKYKPDIYPGQRDLAKAMGLGVMAINKIEKDMEARDDIKRFFDVLGITGRKPRGATYTKRKKV